MKELLHIQQELHAPKTQRNTFGKYNYRSCEDILLAVKPLLEKYECVLLMSDTIKELANPYTLRTSKTDRDGQESLEYAGTRVYVEATATIINKDGLSISVTASAREEVVKKGMDAAQITGATSSYARKYALNGLLCIDDNKDTDATDTESAESSKKKSAKNVVSPATQQSKGVATKETATTASPAPTKLEIPHEELMAKLDACKTPDEVKELNRIYITTPEERDIMIARGLALRENNHGAPTTL